MAPQGYIPVAANVLSTIGTVLWCIQLVPQVWHNWRHKNTEGLPALMMFLWAICSVPFGVYAIVQRFAIPIQVQPQVFGVLALISWGQILYYHDGWSRLKATLAVVVCCLTFGGVELLLVLTLRGPYDDGVTWPILLIGVIAAILLAAGLVPPYFELWKRNGRVIGINWVFLGVDWSGAFFSLLAVCEQETFDALGGVLYIIVCVMELGIFASHGIWMFRYRKQRKEEKLSKKDAEIELELQDEEAKVQGHGESLPPDTSQKDIEVDGAQRRTEHIESEGADKIASS